MQRRMRAHRRTIDKRQANHTIHRTYSGAIVEVAGDAWRYLAWMRPLPKALSERLPLDIFGRAPIEEAS